MSSAETDPFEDPDSIHSEQVAGTEDTLTVHRDASLTLGTDSLVVLDESLSLHKAQKCCGVPLPLRSSPTSAIPYFNVLWAEVNDLEIVIHHASPVSKSHVRVAVVAYPIDKTQLHAATSFCSRLLDRAYGAAPKQRRIKVLVNPFGGQGSADKWYARDIAPIFAAAKCHVDVERTQYSGHAVEIAKELDTEAWDVVACVSGDGVPHEVFNGLAKRKDATKALRSIAVANLPAGSGNAMSINLNGTDSTSLATLCVIKGLRMPLDLMCVTQGDKQYFSFLSQSVGIIAESDLGTENMRWMGDARFTVGVLTRILGKTIYPADVAVKCADDDKTSIRRRYTEARAAALNSQDPPRETSKDLLSDQNDESGPLPPLRFGTVRDPLPSGWELRPYDQLGNFYAGKMPFMARDTKFFAAASPNDGCLDLVMVDGTISRLTSLGLLAAVGQDKVFDLPHVSYRKIEAYRIIPREKTKGQGGLIAVDGESVPFEPFQVEVLPGLGTVLSRTGRWYEVSPMR